MELVKQRIAHLAKHHNELPEIPIPDEYCFPEVKYEGGELIIDGKVTKIAKYIDHTNLSESAQLFQIKELCSEAQEHGFASVCINGAYVATAAEMLEGKEVKVCCVVGFPLGNMTTEAKLFEAEELLKEGANEVDSVLNCGFVKDERYFEVFREIQQLSQLCHAHKAIHKVIIEAACLADDNLIVDASLLCVIGEADFVKTSTGMHSNGGANEKHVYLMRTAVGPKLGVKAAGGIRNIESMISMIENGADRIGASCGVKLVQGE